MNAAERNELVVLYLPIVRSIASAIARCHPANDVDILIGAGNEGLVRAAAHFKPGQAVPFKAFAVQRVRWAVLQETRDRRRLRRLEAREPAELDFVPSNIPAPDATSLDSDVVTRIAKAMAQLSAREQWAISQYYWQERTQAEIAHAFHVTESRVCQVLGEAHAKLRVLLKQG